MADTLAEEGNSNSWQLSPQQNDGKTMSNAKYEKLKKTSSIVIAIPWIAAAVGFLGTGQLLVFWAALTLTGLALFVPGIILGHVARYKTKNNLHQTGVHPSFGIYFGYLGLVVAVGFFIWQAYGDPFRVGSANESSAIGSLRSIRQTAEE